MSSPCGHAEQLTALLFSLQKSFTYLRLVITFPWRLLFSALNNCLSFALFSCPFYFQVEWHVCSWFCVLRSLSTLYNFFVLCVLLGSLGLSPLGLGYFLSALPWNETNIVAEAFVAWEKQQGYFMYLEHDTSVCIIMDFLLKYCLFMPAILCTISQPAVHFPHGISSRLFTQFSN